MAIDLSPNFVNPDYATPEQIAQRQAYAKQLMENQTPVRSWTEGVANMVRSLMGGYEGYKADKSQADTGNAMQQTLASALNPQATPQASAMPSSAPISTGDTTQPRGIRNNNPLNIEAGGFTQSQPGYVGSDGRFAKFQTQDQGLGAASALLDTYKNKYGLNTVKDIVGRWAPAGGKDNNNVSAYAQDVANQLGISPDAPVPPEMRQQLVAAMAKHENGVPLSTQVAGKVPTPDTEDEDQTPTQTAAAGAPTANAPAQPKVDTQKLMMVMQYGNPQQKALAAALLQKQFTDKPLVNAGNGKLYDQASGKWIIAPGADEDKKPSSVLEYEYYKKNAPEGQPVKSFDEWKNSDGSGPEIKQVASNILDGIEDGTQTPELKGLYKYGAQVRSQAHERGVDLAKRQLEWIGAQKQVASLNGPQMTKFIGLSDSVNRTIDEVTALADSMKNSGIPLLNKAKLTELTQLEGNSPKGMLATNYLTAVNTLKEEFAQLANGGYAPTEPAWALANQQINGNYGVDQLKGSLGEIKRLINYRRNAIPGINTLGPGATNRYTGQQNNAPGQPDAALNPGVSQPHNDPLGIR